MKTPTLGKQLILIAFLLIGAPAAADQLVTASLKNGDYGTGTVVAPTTGVVATPDGALFVPTEVSGRSNALINWQIGNNSAWRRTGTITFLFKAIRGQLSVSGGQIVGDNYGFGTFRNGQATFGISASPAVNGPGPDDDRVNIGWSTWHNNVWYNHATTQIEYDTWYSLGFAWGGPSEFEIWVNQERKSAVNIAGSFPWGMDNPPSGYNMGLGDNHERGIDPYNSAAGVMFADIRMWNEYRALGDTVDLNPAPTLAIGDATVAEGDSGTVALTFTVTLTGSSANPVSVTYATAQRTAIAGVDYAHATGTVTFNPGVTGPSTFTVTVNGDTATEIDETLVVSLSGATGGAVITDAQAVGTMTNDDPTTERTAELASWARRIGVTASGGSLTKTGLLGWNAGASSTQSLLTGDGSVEFSAAATDQIAVVGLSHGDTNTNFTDVDFGIELYSEARFYIVEGGVGPLPYPFGAYAVGDRFAVTVSGGIVSYHKNGVTIYTSAIAPTYPLLVDTALFTPGATVADVVIAGQLGRPVTWTNPTGASASGSGLWKTAGVGWNAGAASTRALVSGDGAVEFRTPETTTGRMLGLSRDNANTDFSDIDFGILAAANGTFYVFEGGVSRGLFGAYDADDRFQIAIEAGTVRYRRNGLDVYTSAVAPVYPLLVDTALFTPGATLAGVSLAGTLATDVSFAHVAGAAATGNTLTKTASLGWNTGAFSTRALVQGDGFVEFTTSEATTHKIAGLSHGDTNTGYADVDFGVLLASNGTVYVFEGGVSQGLFGGYQAGDRFRVAVEGGVVKYRRNGVLFYTSAGTPAYPLLVDTALYSPTATIADVVLAGDLGEAVTWTAAVRVSAATSPLTKTGTLGWNAGAISTRAMASGDGFVSFTTNEATTHKLIGLSNGNTDTGLADVDFGILLAANGTYYVFESGTFRGVFGGYVAGDRFEVAVEGGVVKYLRNGGVFYTSGVAPAYPLLVDTALYTPGATIADVVLGCVSAACQ